MRTWLQDSVREFASKEEAEKAWGSPLQWTWQNEQVRIDAIFGFIARNRGRWIGKMPTGLKLAVATVTEGGAA